MKGFLNQKKRERKIYDINKSSTFPCFMLNEGLNTEAQFTYSEQ